MEAQADEDSRAFEAAMKAQEKEAKKAEKDKLTKQLNDV